MINTLAGYSKKLTNLLLKRQACTGIANADEPLEDINFTVIDTELTGLDLKNDSIISIGAVKMPGKRINLGDIFYRLVNPSTGITHESIFIHGITPSDVAEKPLLETVMSEFIDFCGNDVIVGHFISIDLNFINRGMNRIYGNGLNNCALDTCRIYEWIKVNEGSSHMYYGGIKDDLNLFSLARKYRIPISGAHNALNDAFITAQLFQRFLSFLPGFGVGTLRDLLRIGRPRRQ